MQMTGRQRLQCALCHTEPDTVPIFEVLYSRRYFKDILGYAPASFAAEEIATLAAKVGYDFVTINMGGVSGFNAGTGSGDIYTDEWGITYKKNESSWPMDATIGYPLKDWNDWKNYEMPDPKLPQRYDSIRTAQRIVAEHGMGIIGHLCGLYSAAWNLFGMETFCYLMYDEPETIDAVLGAMTDFAITSGLIMLDRGVDALWFADDYDFNTQPLVSPDHFQRYIAPQIARMVQAFHGAGGKVVMHSDGHIAPLLDTCLQAGIDGINPLERGAGMEIEDVKRRYGHRLTIFGNVDNKDLLVNGTPDAVARQVMECLRIAGPGGGYCLGSDHSIHDDIPTENVLAIYETGRKYGKYPIQLPD